MPATILCAGSQPKYLRETFTAEDVKTAKKLIYYSDGDAAEIIFTNEILSISWFHNRHENNSDCYLSSIRYKHYVRGEIYPVSDLAFYADSYAVELPKMNDQIREFDDLFFINGVIKSIPDEQMISGLWNLYDILEEYLDNGINALVSYIPINFRTVPRVQDEINVFVFEKKVSIISDYDMSFSMID